MEDRTCSVDGCPRRHRALGYCNKHYLRLKKHGDPLLGGTKNVTAPRPMKSLWERLSAKVDRGTPGECHMWTGATCRDGYGQMVIQRDFHTFTLKAHRVAYWLHHPMSCGLFDFGNLVVMHTCDTPGCVNPAHLQLGTNADNLADMYSKGRQATGERAAVGKGAKLTKDQVRAIRSDTRTGVVLAREYGVSTACISNLRNRKTWRWVD